MSSTQVTKDWRNDPVYLGIAPHLLGPSLTQRFSTDALGVTQAGLLPSLGVHGGLGLIAYGIARSMNRAELKDYLWPTGMVLNAWWTAVGRHVYYDSNTTLGDTAGRLSYPQKALLGAVTAWGCRLAYRIVTRSLRRGKDDPRYEDVKTQPGFWNKALLSVFLPEAVFQAIISLPFTLPFRTDYVQGMYGAPSKWAGRIRLAAVALFATGFTMETLADWHLDTHKSKVEEQGASGLCQTGVWLIVRHPNYLGDALCHAAFPLWTLGTGLFTSWQVLGPVANYVFLRAVGGDK